MVDDGLVLAARSRQPFAAHVAVGGGDEADSPFGAEVMLLDLPGVSVSASEADVGADLASGEWLAADGAWYSLGWPVCGGEVTCVPGCLAIV
jgi:hypothetical protein